MLTYYRNSVMHVLAIPSLIARFFRHSASCSREEVLASCVRLYPFLKRELFLRVSIAQSRAVLEEHIDNLIELGLLEVDGQGRLCRAEVGTKAYSVLIGLGRILRETFERYTMTSLLLDYELRDKVAPRESIEAHIIEMAQRLAIVSGREAPEYFDKNLFRVYLDTLIAEGLLSEQQNGKTRELSSSPALGEFAQSWVSLLGPDVQQSMLQLIRRPQPSPKAQVSAVGNG